MILFLLGMLLGMGLTPVLRRIWLWADEWFLPARTLTKYKVRKRRAPLVEKNKNKKTKEK